MSVLTPFLPENDLDLANSVLSSLSGLEKSKYSDS